ncbi:MAG TPA: hypothetical protein VEJ20_07755 [Candidatus Eremiobacteraceae bacterium]|nr:hypothetical protein [Candidatus Eremiobacteraceae bacterium]
MTKQTSDGQDERSLDETARACLYVVLQWFDNEDPFWSSFEPEPDSARIEDGRFSVTLRGRGVCLDVRGIMIRDADNPAVASPSLIVGARALDAQSPPQVWHPISCTIGANDRLVTFNFQLAVEAAIADVKPSKS